MIKTRSVDDPMPARSETRSTEWPIIVIAAVGFAFDSYEILVWPLIVRPAVAELTGTAPGAAIFQMWAGRLFYVPALVGGMCGLIGGYLADWIGRRRLLTYSIWLYAGAACVSGFVTSIEWLLIFRVLVFAGVCVEFVAAVSWLAELFPERARRERILGYTQAFASAGGVLVAVVNGLCVAYGHSLPAIVPPFGAATYDAHAPWRYTLMSGLIPALPLMLLRPLLPESPVWQSGRLSGGRRRPSFVLLLAPEFRRTTIVSTVMMAMAYGATFGAIQQIPQIVPGVQELRHLSSGTTLHDAEHMRQRAVARVGQMEEWGGVVGRVLLAFLAVRIARRRRLIRLFQVPGMVFIPTFLIGSTYFGLQWLTVGAFVAAVFSVGQLSFWGNYLPRMYPTHLRSTGEGVAANLGGRVIGTSFAWLTSTLAVTSNRAEAPIRLSFVCAAVALGVYVVGLIASCGLPEPHSEGLPS